MFTRRYLPPAYSCAQPVLVIKPGVVRMQIRKNVTETWAISRPTASPAAGDSPFYLGTYFRQRVQSNPIQRGGVTDLSLVAENVAMDPTNSRTWRRQYMFPI